MQVEEEQTDGEMAITLVGCSDFLPSEPMPVNGNRALLTVL